MCSSAALQETEETLVVEQQARGQAEQENEKLKGENQGLSEKLSQESGARKIAQEQAEVRQQSALFLLRSNSVVRRSRTLVESCNCRRRRTRASTRPTGPWSRRRAR